MGNELVTAFYLAAAILFILALGGLSNQEKAKRAIWYGIAGMALAVIATIFGGSGHFWLLAPMVIIGGAVGAFVASAGADDADAGAGGGLPQPGRAGRGLHRAERRHRGAPRRRGDGGGRADEHLLGLRADAGAQDPGRARDHAGRDLPRHPDRRDHLHRLDRRLRQARRADRLEAADAAQPARDQHRRGAALPDPGDPLLQRRRHLDDGAGGAGRRLHRLAPDHGDRRRRHAGGDLDAEQLLGLGGGGDRLHAVERPADRHRRAGRLLGRDPLLHHVQGDEPELRLGDPRRLRRHHRAGDGDRGRDGGDRRRRGGGDAGRRRTR